MEASKVLKHDNDDMHECHQQDRIDRIEASLGTMNVNMATLTEKVAWILRLNWILVTTVIGAVLAFGIRSMFQ